MQTVWTGIDERGGIVWNAIFLDFARYWGFTPRICRPYLPTSESFSRRGQESSAPPIAEQETISTENTLRPLAEVGAVSH